MTHQDWTDQLRERMADYEAAAPEGLWDDIEQSLPSRQAKTIPLWLRLVGSAAMIIFVAGIGWWLWQERNPNQTLSQNERLRVGERSSGNRQKTLAKARNNARWPKGIENRRPKGKSKAMARISPYRESCAKRILCQEIPVSSTGMREEERYEDDEKNAGWSVIDRKTHQAHVMLGTKGYGMHHPDRIALYLLNNILGGPSLNARLSLSLREHHGLVYTVESTMATYTDTGIWSVYFGCDHSDIKKCLRLVRKELDKVQKKPISSTQLKRAKQQIKGQLGIACDNRESFALDLGKTFLHYNEEKDLQRLYELIDAVSAEQLQHVAQELFDEKRLFTLIYK